MRWEGGRDRLSGRVHGSGQDRRRRRPRQSRERTMSKDKGGRAVKKPKAAKNVKTSGQTPAAGSGAISATTAKGR